MDVINSLTLQVTLIVLALICSHEGTPVGKRLGKRSLNDEGKLDNQGVVVGLFKGNPFKDPFVLDPRLNMVGMGEKEVLGKGTVNKSTTPRQRLLLKDLLASFSNGKRSWPSDNISSNNDDFLTDNNSFFGKVRYRYKKRGGEKMMAVPDSKASARADFMQARRRMGPEFNPTGW